jgi:hypothetical protein
MSLSRANRAQYSQVYLQTISVEDITDTHLPLMQGDDEDGEDDEGKRLVLLSLHLIPIMLSSIGSSGCTREE